MEDRVSTSVAMVLWAISALFVGLRLYYRSFVLKSRIEFSDYLLVLATIFEMTTRVGSYVLAAQELRYTRDGAARQAFMISKLKFQYAQVYWYMAGLCLIKCSFLAGYWKLLPALSHRFKIILTVLAAYCVVISTLVPILVHILICLPTPRNWSLDARTFCASAHSSWHMLNFTIHGVLADTFIIIYGVCVIRTLAFTRRERVAIAFIIFLGLFSMAAALVRFMLLQSRKFEDMWLWCSLENISAVIAACLPTFRAWVRKATETGSEASVGSDKRKQLRPGPSLEFGFVGVVGEQREATPRDGRAPSYTAGW